MRLGCVQIDTRQRGIAQHLSAHMSLGETRYVFGARHRLGPGPDDGWTDIYRMAVQTCEGETVAEIPHLPG